MARRAPTRWSTATLTVCPGAPTALEPSPSGRAAIMTTGTGARNASTAAATPSCGAMTTMPSTRWAMKCSSTRPMATSSKRRSVATVTKYPASRAASSNAIRVPIGP